MSITSASRRPLVLGAAVAVVLSAGAAVLALFQPWKLWVDERVEQAAPAGARPVAVTSSAPPTTPTANASTTVSATAPISGPATVPSTLPTTVPAPATASFVGLDHGTSGRLVLLGAEDGRLFVRFEGLDTSNGPDLKVYLSSNPVDGPEQAFDDDFVDLGRLQGNIGDQNYEVPPGTELTRFRSVVIWCDRFNSAFGAAPLG